MYKTKEELMEMSTKEKRQYWSNVVNEKLGETRMMNCGEIAFIVEYIDSKNVTVQFKNSGELVKCQYGQFKKGEVKSHFSPSVFGVGIVGLEKTKDETGKQLKSYVTWSNMLRRCYDVKCQEKNPTYKDCEVCEEWLYYSNFKKWYDENYYDTFDNQRMDLDKDIINKGNKIYSPDNCVFTPNSITVLFTNSNAIRGDLPIGVSLINNGKYQVKCGIFDIKTRKSKSKYLGCFNTVEEAFEVYKNAKEDNIKVIANYYKEQIPQRLYEAMISYVVEIDD